MESPLTLYMPDPASVRVIECSPPSWMIQLALEEKELEYEVHLLSFSAGEHRSPEMLARNPRGTVPVLTDGPIAIYESFAILEYLEHTYPKVPLLPGTQALRALALTRLHESSHLKSAGMDLFSYLMNAVHLGLPLDERYPNLARFYERMKTRISVVTSWPPWKSTPYRYLAETV